VHLAQRRAPRALSCDVGEFSNNFVSDFASSYLRRARFLSARSIFDLVQHVADVFVAVAVVARALQ